MKTSRIEVESLKRQYIAEGKSLVEIGASFGVTPAAIAAALRRHGIAKRMRVPPLRIRVRLKELGFQDFWVYFKARGRSSYKTMARELGMTAARVSVRYEQFVRDSVEAQNLELPR